jgi:ABC-type Fe3+/spermidine/putrescine transport system ATPase subunit
LVNRRLPRQQVKARVSELLKLVGLPGSEAKYPSQLSGGQQQRIALARALATSPGLLLLDEPLSALDALERVRLRQEIRALQQQLGVTTIMVTHDQEEALSVADRIVVMNHGVIEQVGTPQEVYREPASPFVADFVGKVNVVPGRVRGGQLEAGSLRLPQGGADREVRIYLRPEGPAGAPDRPERSARVRHRHREDRVPGLLLPRARERAGAGGAGAYRGPVAQFPGRTGLQVARRCACGCCRSGSGCSTSVGAGPERAAALESVAS